LAVRRRHAQAKAVVDLSRLDPAAHSLGANPELQGPLGSPRVPLSCFLDGLENILIAHSRISGGYWCRDEC
jgi:hypothetical protein